MPCLAKLSIYDMLTGFLVWLSAVCPHAAGIQGRLGSMPLDPIFLSCDVISKVWTKLIRQNVVKNRRADNYANRAASVINKIWMPEFVA